MRFTGLRVLAIGAAVTLLTPAIAQSQEDGPAPLAQVVTIILKPGGQAVYEAFAQRLAEAAKKVESPIKWGASQAIIGPAAPTYFAVIPLQSWGQIDGWQGFTIPEILIKAYGEEEATRLLQSVSAVTVSTQSMIIGIRPDLANQ